MTTDKGNYHEVCRRFFCESCDERLAFVLKSAHGKDEFILPLSTVLECIFCAEQAGEVPPLEPDWWMQLETLYPTVRDMVNRKKQL